MYMISLYQRNITTKNSNNNGYYIDNWHKNETNNRQSATKLNKRFSE
jgi:hypothetical protein